MTILITGVTGFLGSNLAEYLAAKHFVIGLTGNASAVNFNANTIKIVYPSELDNITEQPDVVVMCHAAVSSGNIALNAETLKSGNIEFTERIISAFPSAKLIYISSVSVYSPSAEPITEASSASPTTEYGNSKLSAENIVLSSQNSVVIRFSSLYGIRMKENTLIPIFVKQAIQERCIKIWGEGQRLQNYIHVSDAVRLIESVIDKNEFNRQVFLGTSIREHTNNEIAHVISKITNASIRHEGQDNAPSVEYNNSLTRMYFNWIPSTTIEKGIDDYIKWKEKQF